MEKVMSLSIAGGSSCPYPKHQAKETDAKMPEVSPRLWGGIIAVGQEGKAGREGVREESWLHMYKLIRFVGSGRIWEQIF